MSYWIYSMGLPVPLSSGQVLSERKVLPLQKLAKNQTIDEEEDNATSKTFNDTVNISLKHKDNRPYQENLDQQNKAKHQAIYRADQIMSTGVQTLNIQQTLADAWDAFQKTRFRHFPVVDDHQQLVGILSDRDLLQAAANGNIIEKKSVQHTMRSTRVSQLMRSPVLTATPNRPIKEICQVMFNQHIGALPILSEQGQLLGIVTRSDILRTMISQGPLELWA